MDLRFTPEEIAFRDEVRAFMRSALPESIRDKMVEGRRLVKDDMVTWQRILNARGWAVPHWPVEWGGTGWAPVQVYLFQDEMQQAPAPAPLPFGVNMVGPVIIAFGSEAQKQRFLPRIANLDDLWCQGFSEPGAGSDLASLHTNGRARGRPIHRQRPEDLDHAGAVCRLDLLPGAHRSGGEEAGGHLVPADRHEDAGHHRAPDRQTIDGGREVNEVFFDDVEVPAENLVGAGEQRLGLCQVPARQRAHRHRPGRRLQGAHPPHQGAGRARARRRQAVDRRRAIPREARRGGGRAEGAGNDAAARRRRRAQAATATSRIPPPRSSRSKARRSSSHHRTGDGGGRALRAAVPSPHDGSER